MLLSLLGLLVGKFPPFDDPKPGRGFGLPCPYLLNLVKVIGSCGLICHMMACFMALSGPGYLRHYAPGDKGCDDDCGSADDWPIRRQYLAALYWAMSTMTTVGYGDITPQSDAERAYCMVGMVVGGGFYGYVIGIIATLVAVSDANARASEDGVDVDVKMHPKMSDFARHFAPSSRSCAEMSAGQRLSPNNCNRSERGGVKDENFGKGTTRRWAS